MISFSQYATRYAQLASRLECVFAAQESGDDSWELQLKHIKDLMKRWSDEDGTTPRNEGEQ